MPRITPAILVAIASLACTPKTRGPTPSPEAEVCDAAACGPALGRPSSPCSDGETVAGPSGRCLLGADGSCGWEVIECPAGAPTPETDAPKTGELAPCAEGECGPTLGMPNTMCPDGKTLSGPSGKCLRNPDGSCGWEVLGCPAT